MSTRLIDAYELAASRPWLIQSDALENILRIAQRQGDISALQTREGKSTSGTTSMRNGVAVIPITGPIFRHANLFTAISGATSTEMLAREIQAAADNAFVRAIVLDIHSPGGDAAGIHELAEMIRATRAIKPIKAYIGGSGASAAYWLAAATDEVIVDATALVGSIGVVMTHRPSDDETQSIDIVSSQTPHKRLDLHSDEGRGRVQALVDRIADEFIGAVARHRGVSIQTVIEKFGGGDVLVGADAVRAGMADRLGSLESVIAELSSPRPAGKKRAAAPSPTASTPQESTMPPSANTRRVVVSTTEQLHDAIAAGHSVEQITIATDLDRAAAARAEGVAEGRALAAEEATLAERARVTKINTMTRTGFEALATTAINEGHSAEQFAMAMFDAGADRGISLDAISNDAPRPAAHASPGDDAPPPPRAPNAAQVYQLRRAQTQAKR